MLAVAVMAVMLAMTGGGALIGSAVVTRHRAQAAADLGALAAASRLASGPGDACGSATTLVTAARAAMASCTVTELDVVVVVEIPVGFGRWGVGKARASARAGPA